MQQSMKKPPKEEEILGILSYVLESDEGFKGSREEKLKRFFEMWSMCVGECV